MEHKLTPKKIVELLDKYIVGQKEAKKAIAIALRTRYRRHKVSGDIKEEIMPKNILMIGPTGVGKTEIARRIAKITNAPFVKVEASKFTEVGYVGRDVESIIRDLARISYEMVKQQELKKVEDKAEKEAEERVLDILVPPVKKRSIYDTEEEERVSRTREKFREKLKSGELNEKIIEITINPQKPEQMVPFIEVAAAPIDELDSNLKDMLDNLLPGRKKTRKVTVKEALKILKDEEAQKLIDKDKVKEKAIEKASNDGIVFIDEIDKIISKSSSTSGPDVSREGVQRDLLPIVEGSSVNTRYGIIKTDHILFIAAGAFHQVKPSDMIPELQGRFPIRVELRPLTKGDFIRILREPKNALIKQYKALLETEGIEIKFSDDAIEKIAEIAEKINKETENIGARRLHTLLEKLLEDISFEAPDIEPKEITIDAKYVGEKLSSIVEDRDLSRYIL
ncbi:ATP-dependent protease ATPase subunit HslU [Hippea maritima]|uniref:ATP-dependent protease ATPase subunit HslU n=1 Tax=Hippea maritima (strain ATCC 700847 / DSM 10411 / MH2) TaxID=760142 RepID=F2LU28_HIPMA|nr:ATP-dependent protease ATPase subunit HslU [Hippea maritima]AEA33427.1 ATP-dependent hsl protease ATP-binding subunit hslU [Hippea maritima DSM 10411]